MNNTKICCNCKFFKNSTHYCRCLEKETLCKDTCGSFEFPKPIDWEQRRYEIAKDMIHAIYLDEGQEERSGKSDIPFEYKDMASCAREAVEWADALIEELKKTSE